MGRCGLLKREKGKGHSQGVKKIEIKPPSCSSTTNDALECQPMSRRFAIIQNKNLNYVDRLYLYN